MTTSRTVKGRGTREAMAVSHPIDAETREVTTADSRGGSSTRSPPGRSGIWRRPGNQRLRVK